MLKIVILAGGRGERFWPLSRGARPKPLLELGEGQSLLKDTLRRALGIAPAGNIQVVAGAPLASAMRGEMRGMGGVRLVVEPSARNTGPATLLAARLAWGEDPGAEMLVLPSDHRVVGLTAFRRAVTEGRRLARLGFLVTFGISPDGPRSDFGYIVPGGRIGGGSRRVARFVEKPPPAVAARLMARDGAAWNSGMFVWRVDAFLEEASRCEPTFARWVALSGRGRGIRAAARRAFRNLPSLPVDKAVLERSDRVAMVRARFGWSDLGTWASLEGVLPRAKGNNLHWGELVSMRSSDNLVVHPGGLTVLSGMKECLVVCSGGVVLVCPRSDAGKMREILRQVEKAGYGDYL